MTNARNAAAATKVLRCSTALVADHRRAGATQAVAIPVAKAAEYVRTGAAKLRTVNGTTALLAWA
jgi:hypothetical protein